MKRQDFCLGATNYIANKLNLEDCTYSFGDYAPGYQIMKIFADTGLVTVTFKFENEGTDVIITSDASIGFVKGLPVDLSDKMYPQIDDAIADYKRRA